MSVHNMTYFMRRFGLRTGAHRQYLLIPPLYTVRKHTDGLPSYAYAYSTLMLVRDRMNYLWADLSKFRERLMSVRGLPKEQP